MGECPLISVLIPCYNNAAYIGETLECVLHQSYPNLEIVVVNDGSTDHSADEIRRFARPNLTFIDQVNRGAAASRNNAFSASHGAFVQFLDADDLLSPNKIASQFERLRQSNLPNCVASCEWGRFYDDDLASARIEPESVWRDMLPLDWIAESGLRMLFPALWLIPRDVALAAGPWDERLTLADDMEYFTRMLVQARRVLFCRGARAYYRSGVAGSLSGRRTRGAWLSAFEVNRLCEHHVREQEDSQRMRMLFSGLWQTYAHNVYPYDASLGEAAMDRAHILTPGYVVRPGGGPAFKAASALVGWRRARKWQVALGRR